MAAEDLKIERRPSDVPITKRNARQIAPEWVDRLLLATAEIAPGNTPAEAAETLIVAIADLLPAAAIGACIADGGGQVVIERASRSGGGDSRDPTRLFPQYAFERVVVIELDESSTLHLASDSEDDLADDGPYRGLLDRLSLTLGSSIRHCRAAERTRAQTAEMRGLKAQVIQSDKLASLGQIAAGIVHELNNPLTSIVAYSDYLRKKAQRNGTDPSDVERLLRINEAADRILRFARDLIAYSRPSTEVPAPVDIREVIERALVFCEHVILESGVTIDTRFAVLPPIFGVAGQLTQVFVNLFTNASHAMRGRGGCLSVLAEPLPDGRAVLVTVSDDGHGIDDEHLPRIFDPFFTTKADGGGTGLGLSIVRNIIVSHGGRIHATRHEPAGTVFRIELPLAGTSGDE